MKNARKFWALAVIFGLVAALLAYQYTEKVKARYEPDNLVEVVKAAVDISRDSIITPEQVEVERVPAQFSHPAAARSQQAIIGKVATSDISAGEQILTSKVLTDKSKAGRLAYCIPEGKRAVSIAVNPVIGVAGLVKPGDRVDVIGTVDLDSGGTSVVVTTIFLQDIEVLAVGKTMTESRAVSVAEAKEIEAKTMTLAVSPEEVRSLVLVAERGSIRLALRSPVDEGRAVLPPCNLQNAVGH
ncbi:MAG: Flp pilus assembly protein CpaB [Syntrophomonadaceae bacterium]|jgi:pilus assembly protein CpaB|nr:Flp pilus assembly protein CpaB [Syntrophomonadaceae bacterium]